MNPSDKQFELRARTRYLEATQHLDPVTAGRLRAARRTALSELNKPAHARSRSRLLLPISAMAAVAMAVMVIWQPDPDTGAGDNPNARPIAVAEADSELPPGAEKADPGLYQNIEFYSWLAANDHSQAEKR